MEDLQDIELITRAHLHQAVAAKNYKDSEGFMMHLGKAVARIYASKISE